MKRLLIIHAEADISKTKPQIQEFRFEEWIPLVADYGRVKQIQKELTGNICKKDISMELQETAVRLRRPFYDITAGIGRRYNSLEWWANSISERNTMVSKLFLRCCYVFLANSYLLRGTNLCIICDNNSVIDNIEMLAARQSYVVTRVKPSAFFILQDTCLGAFFRGLGRLLKGIWRWLLTRFNGIRHRLKGQIRDRKNPDIVIHTWVDEKCFGEGGKFRDRYFTILPQYYKNKGLNVATLVTFFDVKRSGWKALNFFRNNNDDFIVPEDYYRIQDYFFPFYVWLRRLRFRFDNTVLEGVDCSYIFKANNKTEEINFVTMYFLLFKRLAAKGLAPKMLIDGFENMVSDKMIQLGVRKFMPGTLLYGFYHIAPPPNVLCFFTDRKETDIAPLPDRIICNGDRFKAILLKEHFPEKKIVVGAALRYLYLYDIKKVSVPKKHGQFNILLTLPLETEAAVEIFNKTAEAIQGIERYVLLIKPHPMGTSVIKEIKNSFTAGTEVVQTTMAEAISRCDMVVSAATSAALDCLMANKQVIRVGRETQLDFDPLAWFEEFGPCVYSVPALREKILEIENKIIGANDNIPDYSTMLPELFAPLTEEHMEAFLPNNIKMFSHSGAGL